MVPFAGQSAVQGYANAVSIESTAVELDPNFDQSTVDPGGLIYWFLENKLAYHLII